MTVDLRYANDIFNYILLIIEIIKGYTVFNYNYNYMNRKYLCESGIIMSSMCHYSLGQVCTNHTKLCSLTALIIQMPDE